jgi:hypothetical protein
MPALKKGGRPPVSSDGTLQFWKETLAESAFSTVT